MAVNKGFAYAYGWNVYYQMVLGVCSKSSEGVIAKQRAWAWAILMIVCIWIPQTASLSFLWGDLNSIIDCLSTNLSIAISIVKISALQCQRRVIGSILDTITEDWEWPRSKEEIVIMYETAKTSRFISIMSVSLTNLMFVAYIVSQVWSTLHIGRDPGVDSRLAFGFLFDSYFPFGTTNPVIFVPIWLGQFFSTLLSMVSYSGPDCIVAMMVLHLCGQLRIVRHSLKNVVNKATVREPKKYWKTLIPIVKRHEELNQSFCVSWHEKFGIKLLNEDKASSMRKQVSFLWIESSSVYLNLFSGMSLVIKETFSSILLVQMTACSVTFCFQGYAMFTTLMDRNGTPLPVYNLAFSFLYGSFTVIHLFVYCYVGDRLLAESTKIPDDFYDTPWYDLAPKEARAFLFVCHRSKIPLRLNAGKFCTFNLQLFNGILKNSMGYLSMLMAMKERLIDY